MITNNTAVVIEYFVGKLLVQIFELLSHNSFLQF